MCSQDASAEAGVKEKENESTTSTGIADEASGLRCTLTKLAVTTAGHSALGAIAPLMAPLHAPRQRRLRIRLKAETSSLQIASPPHRRRRRRFCQCVGMLEGKKSAVTTADVNLQWDGLLPLLPPARSLAPG